MAGCAPVVGELTNNWVPVQNGLHVLYSGVISAITAGSDPFRPFKEGIYLPTQDNDTFATTFGGDRWQSLNDGLGDSNQALADPAFPIRRFIAQRKLRHL